MKLDEIRTMLETEALERRQACEDQEQVARLRLKKSISVPREKRMPAGFKDPTANEGTVAGNAPAGLIDAFRLAALLAVICGLAWLGWQYYPQLMGLFRKEEVAPVISTPVVSEPAPVSVPLRPAVVMPQVSAFTCPTCGGKGNHRWPGAELETSTYSCPVCFGKGVRKTALPKNAVVCGTCRGMGRIGKLDELFKTKRRYEAAECRECGGRGWEVNNVR